MSLLEDGELVRTRTVGNVAELRDLVGLFQLPGDGVLAASGSYDEEFHGQPGIIFVLTSVHTIAAGRRPTRSPS